MNAKNLAMNLVEKYQIMNETKTNEQIINELVENYKDMIFNLLYRMTSNYDDALELTQDTFLRAYEALPRFRYESSLKTWIYKIAFNMALNYKKKWRFFKKKDSCVDDNIMDCRSNPEDETSQKQLSSHIQNAINQLPADQKAMILLREIEELSYEEISHILNVPVGTVKSRLSRARFYLKQLLADVETR